MKSAFAREPFHITTFVDSSETGEDLHDYLPRAGLSVHRMSDWGRAIATSSWATAILDAIDTYAHTEVRR